MLQGPGTDPTSVDIIRRNLAAGRETSLCLLNYRADGTAFWNQLYIGALRDREGRIVNHVGVQTEVPALPATEFHRRLHRVPLPEDLMHEEGERSAAAAHANNNSGSRHSARQQQQQQFHSSSNSSSSVFAAAGRAAAGHYNHMSGRGSGHVSKMARHHQAASAAVQQQPGWAAFNSGSSSGSGGSNNKAAAASYNSEYEEDEPNSRNTSFDGLDDGGYDFDNNNSSNYGNSSNAVKTGVVDPLRRTRASVH
jgi:hypothetical protein